MPSPGLVPSLAVNPWLDASVAAAATFFHSWLTEPIRFDFTRKKAGGLGGKGRRQRRVYDCLWSGLVVRAGIDDVKGEEGVEGFVGKGESVSGLVVRLGV